jgi:hypothetical protein
MTSNEHVGVMIRKFLYIMVTVALVDLDECKSWRRC